MSRAEERLALVKQLRELIEAQPAVSTDELEEKLIDIATLHFYAEELEGSETESLVPEESVSTVMLMSLMHEVLLYRNKYGLIRETNSECSEESE